MITGKSAQLTKNSSLSAMVRGADQDSPSRVAKRSAKRPRRVDAGAASREPTGSSQLIRTRPSSVANKLGVPAPSAPGEGMSSIRAAVPVVGSGLEPPE